MIRIGTRTSKLAMIQTELVKQKIQEHFPKEKIEIVPIITKGDVILHQPLASFGGKGVFTQEIEQQLLDKTIDIAVHSAKDVPMQLADGLCIGAVLAREDCRDVLVTRSSYSHTWNFSPRKRKSRLPQPSVSVYSYLMFFFFNASCTICSRILHTSLFVILLYSSVINMDTVLACFL